jgi:hypothetical protein
MEYVEQLPAQSFAAMVYWVFVIGVIMILTCFLEKTYRINKRWALLIVLCPPLSLIFIKKNWDETKALCFFFVGFYLVIIFAGSLSGYHMTAFTTEILQKIFLWPIVVGNWLLENPW